MTHARSLWVVGLCLFLALVTPIFSAEPEFDAREVRRVLRLSPLPEPPVDPSNGVATDPAAQALGQRFFFDPRLSGDRSQSCATCHDPAQGWSNGKAVADAGIRFPRNVPSLWNNAYGRWFFWDGRADSTWSQALIPLEDPREMNISRLRLIHRIRGEQDLRTAYEEVFGPLPEALADSDRFPASARPISDQLDHSDHRAWATMTPDDRLLANRIFSNIGKALAAYERTLVTPEAPFDRFARRLRAAPPSTNDGPQSKSELSASAIRGLKLFLGKGQCTLCHSGANFSDGEFHDVGLGLGAGMRIDPGRYRGVTKILASPFNRSGTFSDNPEPYAPITFLELGTEQLSQFKTPSLRQLKHTAPYMHDGRFATLEEVVRFYSNRHGATPLKHGGTLLQPLNLEEQEIKDLVAFLESLSGPGPDQVKQAGQVPGT